MPSRGSVEADAIEKYCGFILQDMRRLVDALRLLEESDASPLKAATYDAGPGSPSTTSDPTSAAALGLSRGRARGARKDAASKVRKAAQLLTDARGVLEAAVR